MGQALYRRYRSKNLAEIVGQEHITRTLDNTLKRGAIGHAYLLTGPKGVGKTSIARILAHEINELPYEQEKVHLDIIEIDAASNRRIDEIRDLRDKVHMAPTSAKYKVYIIDEVHMLTKEAFNALLKTLEEPPKHVIFILATTDVHKLPETIISRTQHFTFKPIPVPKIIDHLKTIAKQESVDIEDGALELIANHSGGSFRDSIGLLEQSTGVADKVTTDLVRQMLGVPPKELITELTDAVYDNNAKDIIAHLESLLEQGYLAEEVAQQLSRECRERFLNGAANPAQTTSLIRDLIDVPASADPAALLEVVLLSNLNLASVSHATVKQSNSESKSGKSEKPQQHEQKEQKVEQKKATEPAAIDTDTEVKQPNTEVVEMPVQTPEITEHESSTESHGIIDEDAWQSVLNELKRSHSTLYSVARMADFNSDGKDITLHFKFPFHKKRMESTKHVTILDELLYKITKTKPRVRFELSQRKVAAPPPVKEQAEPQDSSPVEAISNIFGGAEVLES